MTPAAPAAAQGANNTRTPGVSEAPAAAPNPAVAGALQLLRTCCATGNAKLGLRVAQAYGIRLEQVQAAGMVDEVGACVSGLLESAEGSAVWPLAVAWLMHFEVRYARRPHAHRTRSAL